MFRSIGNARGYAPSLALRAYLITIVATGTGVADEKLKKEATEVMRKAATFYREKAALKGGYVYYYSPDLKVRWGEGPASKDQVWVQPPGTPTVGLAYVAAYRATGDEYYRQAAQDTADALLYGQLESGGWQNAVDFDPKGKLVGQYRSGKGKGRNLSTFDDGITQTALRFLMNIDQAFEFKNNDIRKNTKFALDSVLAAQYANGGFPQVWDKPAPSKDIVKAVYPDYDWKTENRIKEYWNLYTLNDDLAVTMTETLLDAAAIYKDSRANEALTKLGDFLIVAQMPDPQPAWAQQYDFQMRPVWARKFEPPAIAGRESQGAIATLMRIYQHTGDEKYLEPIPRAIAYLKKSRLKDGRLARYYELKTNKPLYMTEKYELTHDDSRAPSHYGWKGESRIEELAKQYDEIRKTKAAPPSRTAKELAAEVKEIVRQLDDEGRWISKFAGEPLNGQPKYRPGDLYISSAVFAKNLEAISEYLQTGR